MPSLFYCGIISLGPNGFSHKSFRFFFFNKKTTLVCGLFLSPLPRHRLTSIFHQIWIFSFYASSVCSSSSHLSSRGNMMKWEIRLASMHRVKSFITSYYLCESGQVIQLFQFSCLISNVKVIILCLYYFCGDNDNMEILYHCT